MKYLLDTNICIYALNKRPPGILERLRAVGPTAVSISVITAVELRHGAEKSRDPAKANAKLDRFFSPIKIFPFDESAALRAGRLRAELDRRGRPIGDFDSLIAAQALALNLILVSNNLREFDRVSGLVCENWVEA